MIDLKGLKLNDGNTMPQLGLGLYKVSTQAELTQVVKTAWEQGYRLFDSAQMYQNEDMFGLAAQELNLPREEYFLTTKIAEENQGYDNTLRSFEKSLKDLQVDYVDMLMVHWPLHQHFFETWKAFEYLKEQGVVKSIGVSNYGVIHLQYLATKAHIMPAVDQVENHPFLTQDGLLEFNKSQGIITQAWAPLGRARALDEPVLVELAQKYHKSAAQIVLRWHWQRGTAIIPKSVHAARIIENADIFDFELAQVDMQKITDLNTFTRISQEPEQVYELGHQYPHH